MLENTKAAPLWQAEAASNSTGKSDSKTTWLALGKRLLVASYNYSVVHWRDAEAIAARLRARHGADWEAA